ncbi:MAG: deoxyribodipyrimidine photo-lyase [Phycisphaeraceae bacterium]|nr:deoxyribodipyrimidine photo-lyase [Phycisphaeraceae bacterium]
MSRPTIHWFRRDLRLQDNPALAAAMERGPVICLYIDPDFSEAGRPLGGASRWWLHHSLVALDASLKKQGSGLIVRSDEPKRVLRELAADSEAEGIFWNRIYEPEQVDADQKIESALRREGLETETFNGSLLYEPGQVLNQSDEPYKVFTPFWRAARRFPAPDTPLRLSDHWARLETGPKPLSIEDLQLLPKIAWDEGLAETWTPGETEARRRAESFVSETIDRYPDGRDRMDLEETSGLSAHLHFGEISPNQIWHIVRQNHGLDDQPAESFLRQLGWREFAHHILIDQPHTPDEPLNESFKNFPWKNRPAQLRRWQRGETGYPIVDAAMRHLWATGTMPNRARMIVASFLTKHLLIPWQKGADWFWDTLVDADLANNTLGWQWTAGCGADAAPYFRIFNPTLQAEKYDPEGDYVRRWVPELADLPDRWLNEPHRAPAEVLKKTAVKPGKDYPHPMVDHAEARDAALEAYQTMKRKAER